jgi:hypothetical protein
MELAVYNVRLVPHRVQFIMLEAREAGWFTTRLWWAQNCAFAYLSPGEERECCAVNTTSREVISAQPPVYERNNQLIEPSARCRQMHVHLTRLL